MLKHRLAIAAVAVLMTAGTASAEVWEGDGNPCAVFTQCIGVNSATYNFDDEFSNGEQFPGIMTANGNGGGLLHRAYDPNQDGVIENGPGNVTAAAGWYAEWRSRSISNSHPLNANTTMLQFNDDVSNFNVQFSSDGSAASVRLLSNGVSNVTTASVAIGDITPYRTYRAEREPGSADIIFKVDGNQVLSITPDVCGLPGCDAGNLNNIHFAPSAVEWAYDRIEWGEIPEPATLALFGVAAPFFMRRRR